MDVLMPQLGETVAEGKITKWFKSAGEPVKPGDNLFEIETDKVSMEVPSTTAGVLAEIRVAAGEVAPVGAVVGVIADGTGAAASPPVATATAAKPAAQTAPPRAASSVAQPRRQTPIKLDPFFEVRTPERNFGPARLAGGITVTPLARRLASEAGIELAHLHGFGPHGRIVARDVDVADAPRPSRAQGPSAAEVKALYAPGSYQEVPLDGMRRTIAARLTQAAQTVPHFYLTTDVVIDRLIALREEANAAAPKDKDGNPEFKLSLNDFIIRALALALQRVPAANAVWADDRILRFKSSDIGVAVALDGGLLTPVIRNAETKSLTAISAAMEGPFGAGAGEKAQTRGVPGRSVGDLESRHAWRARIRRHHQSAACDHPRRRRRAPASGRNGRRRIQVRQHVERDVELRSSRGRRRARRRAVGRHKNFLELPVSMLV